MSRIVVNNLTREFETPAGPLRILEDITLELDEGENLAVVGPSGSGKSTFLQIVGTLDHPTSGSVRLLGQDPSTMDEAGLAKFRNQNLGFIFQEHHLLPQLSALENVLLPVVAGGKANDSQIGRANELLARVGLQDRTTHRPGQLSGGERQRVAVARALMNAPAILLADEPTGSLDHANTETIGRLLLDLQKQDNVTLICVTHNDQLATWFDRRLSLDEGKFVELSS